MTTVSTSLNSPTPEQDSSPIDRRASFVYQPPLSPAFEIIYQDDDLIVLNKPAGLLSVPGRLAMHKDSLSLRLQRVYPQATIVHRLDMATSGLLVMPLHKTAHKRLQWQFEARSIQKNYQAIVAGHVADDEGEIVAPLMTDWPRRPMQKIDFDSGKPAKTQYQVIARETLNDQGASIAVTRVLLKPITGRTHQLRVHMLSIGHAICGDRLYAEDPIYHSAPRLLLHAQALKLTQPMTNKPLEFVADTPF